MRKNQLFAVILVLAIFLVPAAVYAKKSVNVYLESYTLSDQPVELPQELIKHGYMNGEVGPYIIAFGGPIEDPMTNTVRELGAQLVDYIPDFSFLALMTPETATQVQYLPFVTEVQIFHPAYKIHSNMKDENGNIKGEGLVTVNIQSFTEQDTALNNLLNNVQGNKIKSAKNITVAKVDRKYLNQIAHLNSVKSIEEAPVYVLFNDVANGIMDVDDLWIAGYEGAGQVVGICDTGLDTGVNNTSMHLDFQGRIDAIFALGRATADDPHGHGTHVAGSVLGSGARSNGQFKGMAPAAHVVFQSVLDSAGGLGGLPADLNDLFTQSWNAGARIHTNSWGSAVGGAYTTDSMNVDEYTWNNKDLIVLFAAGNEGRNPKNGRIVYNSISAPGSAKNCITIGASENYRPEKGSYGDNIDQVALFSSKGWTDDGRVKPDICAPGTWILSTRSSLAADSAFWEPYNSYYAYMGGTSMATPLTAGAVASARQYMQNVWGVTPKASLMKAALINGAVDMGYGLPSQDQGWGRVSLSASFTTKEYKYDNESTALSTNGTKTYTYTVASAATPLKVTLVWTDYPSTTTASKNLVNDLDLVITSPSGQVYYGNDFVSPYNDMTDRTNNVENIFISNPEIGTYTITVKAYNVPYGPQTFGMIASGDFQ